MKEGDRIRRKGLSLATHEIVEFRHGQGETYATLRKLATNEVEPNGLTVAELVDKWEKVEGNARD